MQRGDVPRPPLSGQPDDLHQAATDRKLGEIERLWNALAELSVKVSNVEGECRTTRRVAADVEDRCERLLDEAKNQFRTASSKVRKRIAEAKEIERALNGHQRGD